MKRELKEKIYFLIFIILFLSLVLLTIIIKKEPKEILFAPGDNDAKFVSQSIPALMQAGEAYELKILYENIGVNTWTATGRYKLGNRNYGNLQTFGQARIDLSSTDVVMPGQTKEFTFIVSAPQDTGDYFIELQMVQENVEWFGETTPRIGVRVVDNRLGAWGNADPEPALAWLAQSSNGKAAWLINRPRDGSFINEPGHLCPNGFGWNNTQLTISQLNRDGTLSRKEVTVKGCLLSGTPEDIDPWGSTPDLFRYYSDGIQNGVVIPKHWAIVKSSGMRKDSNGVGLEEYQPYPGIIIVPPEIIPDGQEHIVQKCYNYETYFSENGGTYACYDSTCYSGGNIGSCPGRGTLINSKYIVYDYCEGNFCYANGNIISSPVNFRISTPSVLRVSYTLTAGTTCTDRPTLTEEQWFVEGIGFAGFSNDWPLSPAPNSVDFYGVFENNKCLPYWDGLCNVDPYNYNTCCPEGHSSCNVYLSDKVIPSIVLTNPLNNEEVSGILELRAQANDNVGVSKVEFYVDHFLKNEDYSSPYSYNLDTHPLSNGLHKITARVYDSSDNFYTTEIIKVNVNNNNKNDAKFVSQIVPTNMIAGQNYSVNVTFNNTGSRNWLENQKYKLGSQNPQDNLIWGLNRVNLSENEIVSLGEVRTFSFNVTAPSISKTYNFSWRMIQEGVEWFGDTNLDLVIFVGEQGRCGDNICNASIGETCSSCSQDCGSCNSGNGGGGGGGGGSPPKKVLQQCEDGKDNDGDGLIDYPVDLGCDSLLDDDESTYYSTKHDSEQEDNSDETGSKIKSKKNWLRLSIVFVLILGIIVVSITIFRLIKKNRKFENLNSNFES